MPIFELGPGKSIEWDNNKEGYDGVDPDNVGDAEKGESPFPVRAIFMSASSGDIMELWNNRKKKKCNLY